jgi:hypothetical protein
MDVVAEARFRGGPRRPSTVRYEDLAIDLLKHVVELVAVGRDPPLEPRSKELRDFVPTAV